MMSIKLLSFSTVSQNVCEEALILDGLLAKACSLEASEVQAAGMEQKLVQAEEVNRVTQQWVGGQSKVLAQFKYLS